MDKSNDANFKNECVKFRYTPYKISTITATGCINTMVDLDLFYEHIKLVQFKGEEDGSKKAGIVFIEYGKKKENTFFKGYNKKQFIQKRKKEVGKRFDNQATVVLKSYIDDIDSNEPQYANLKVFKNGNIQITGLKTIDHGVWVINFIIKYVWDMERELGRTIFDKSSQASLTNYKICLINSDYRVNFDINRELLNRNIQKHYNIFCSYEPCIYPGVKIQYNWNSEQPNNNGACMCSEYCNGKGIGHGNGMCKKITIAVFQSGCIIITGAQSYAQIDTAYNFINGILDKFYDAVKKTQLPQPHGSSSKLPMKTQLDDVNMPKKQDGKIIFKKSLLVNPQILESLQFDSFM